MIGLREGSSANLLTVQSVSGNSSRIPSPSGIAGPFGNALPRNLMTPEAFISIQLEKVNNWSLLFSMDAQFIVLTFSNFAGILDDLSAKSYQRL
jgi:hypothetical protein